ncbi:MAG: hypothetical protein KAG66_21690, partial [Methylococcales bacterium]|nr:hypothetical protein [Methylococcales bacterium]
ANAAVISNAKAHGNGGKVIVFAEDTAIVLGSIAARGGRDGGNGGFVETSGKQQFYFENAPDVSAPNGKGGTWLIDPYDITIDNIAGAGSIDITNTGSNSGPFSGANAPDGVWDSIFRPEILSVGSGSILDIDDIKASLLNGGDVIITTSETPISAPGAELGNIIWNADLDLNEPNGGSVGSLTLLAHNDINLNASIYDSDSFSSGGGDQRLTGLTLNANQDGVGGGDVNIDAAGGDVTIDVNGDFTMTGDNVSITGADTQLGAVNINAAGTVNIGSTASPIDGDITIQAGQFSSGTGLGDRGQAAVTIRGDSVNMNATGDVAVLGGDGHYNSATVSTGTSSGSLSINASNILLQAGGGSGSSNSVK